MNDLSARLAELAAQGLTITYGALARDLGIPGPGAIARLTTQLEALMAQDAANQRPLRAALCAGRLGNGLPALGFFENAAALGCYDGRDPMGFVLGQRQALWQQSQP